MNIEINGENLTVPYCTCGKCIIKRNREGNRNSKYPYNNKMSTTYTNSFQKKGKGLSAVFLNRSIRNNFDGKYKEHLTSGLMSTMKFDFKPYLIKSNKNQDDLKDIENIPFYGRSTYGSNFPSWGKASSGNEEKEKLPFISIPFRGGTNYSDNYIPHETQKNYPFIKQESSLGFNGKILNDSNVRESYRPIERFFSMEKPKKNEIEKDNLIAADYPKEFGSTYGNSFKILDSQCELANYLKKSGMKNLEL
jgi:hypothetical protein